MKIFLIIILSLALLYVLSILLIFRFMFFRRKHSAKVPKAYIDTPHYNVSRAGMAVMDKLPVEDLYMYSADGLRLHAYYYPTETDSKKFILGIHGYKSYARPEFGPYIEFYRSLGYNMLLPDDRAHRPSEGRYIGFGILDRLDCVDWAKYITEHFGTDSEIILHGVSMGGATVLAASGEEDLPSQVVGVISDCGFSSAWDVLKYEIKHMAHLPVKAVLPACNWLCRHLAGYDLREHSAAEQVKKAKVPILFVQGGRDNMVPPYMADELYEACGSEKQILKVPEAAHAESIAFEPEKYYSAIHELFKI